MKITARVSVATIATMSIAATAGASLTTITFENDPVGPTSNSFVSADSPLVTFSNTVGLGLAVGDNDNSALVMSFSTVMDFLSVDFGNDDPLRSQAGDTAILTLF